MTCWTMATIMACLEALVDGQAALLITVATGGPRIHEVSRQHKLRDRQLACLLRGAEIAGTVSISGSMVQARRAARSLGNPAPRMPWRLVTYCLAT